MSTVLSYELTRYALTLGTRDATTGWYSKTYASSTIDGVIQRRGSSLMYGGFGYYAKYDYTGLTADGVLSGDKLVDSFGNTYRVKSAQQEVLMDSHSHWVSDLEKVDSIERPATTDSWHLDSTSAKTDSRYRNKLYLDTYLSGAALTLDNGSGASYITCFDGADYPVTRVFIDDEVDLAFYVGKSVLTAKFTKLNVEYCFTEAVTITIYAVNKTTVTAARLIDQAEEEIKRIFTAYTLNRQFRRIDAKPMWQDGLALHSAEIMIEYTRANDSFTPTYPTVTWGPSASPTGTYTFPNITDLKITLLSNTQRLTIPGRLGQWPQKLGLPDAQIDIFCDLEIEPWSGASSDTKISWKRPQTNGSKTDIVKWQVFQDIRFSGQGTETYQTMNLGYGTTFKVTLDDVYVDEVGQTLHLKFYGYNTTALTAYKNELGINP